jgi:carbonic anhydrase
MEQAAVRVSLDNLMTFPCVRSKVAKGELRLRGAFFAIADGVLHFMDAKTSKFAPVS